MKYFISSGFNFQDGIYRNSATNYSQVDFRSNIDGKITDNISLSVDLAGRQEDRKGPAYTTSYIFGSLITGGAGSGGRPNQIAWYPGNRPATGFIGGMNPVVMGTNIPGYNNEKSYVFESNVKLLVTIPWVKGLSVTSNISFDKDITNGKLWIIPYDRSRELKLRLLNKAKIKSEKLKWQFINITGPVLLVIATGLLYNYFRKRKYSRY